MFKIVLKADGQFQSPAELTADHAEGLATAFAQQGLESEKNAETRQFSVGIPNNNQLFGRIRLFRQTNRESAHIEHTRLLCVIAVPLHIPAAEFGSFISPYQQEIEHLAFLRDTKPNVYTVLLLFRTAEQADEFYRAMNNKPFNSLEPERCHVVRVSSVELAVPANIGVPDWLQAAFSAQQITPAAAAAEHPGFTELPTCPVCLERLDASASGLLTTVCSHSFHCHCLTQWKDSSCPVCRYTHAKAHDTMKCDRCDATSDLWMCLICGNVGCGRYSGEHAKLHFADTAHTYAFELSTQRVWDYAGDGYVHRLIWNKTDGKVVELPDPHMSSDMQRSQFPPTGQTSAAEPFDYKMDSILQEYNLLLTSQLEAQREWYEAKMKESVYEERMQCEQLREDLEHERQKHRECADRLAAVDKERKALIKKNSTLTKRIAQVQEELTFQQQMNEQLASHQADWEARVKAVEMVSEKKCSKLREEIAELQEQVRDLMFTLDTQSRIEASEDKNDIQSGAIVVSSSSADGSAHAATRGSSQKKRRSGKKR